MVHVKYNDSSSIISLIASPQKLAGLMLTSGIISVYSNAKIAQFLKKTSTAQARLYTRIIGGPSAIAIPFVAGLAYFKLLQSIHKYLERRADIEGLNAAKCYRCSTEMLRYRKGPDNGPDEDGYLQFDEINRIVIKQMQAGLVCDFHNPKIQKQFRNMAIIFEDMKTKCKAEQLRQQPWFKRMLSSLRGSNA